jgi:hypothetical protein
MAPVRAATSLYGHARSSDHRTLVGLMDSRAPKNLVMVAMANKLARIAWAGLSNGEDYRPQPSVSTA